MTQSKYTRPDNTTQSASAYKANIDNGFETFERAAGSQFQAHEQSTPDMTVRLEAGDLWDGPGNAPDVIAAQSTGTITAPSTNPRIDRVVIDTSGVVSVITGSEAASPTAPAVTAGKIPICQVALATSTTSITNSLITDERPSYLGDPSSGAGGLNNVVEDTTPQLGGQLDVNGNAIGDGTLELLSFTETGSAVNHVNITNAATGNAPLIDPAGDDTNVDLKLKGKGTGVIKIGDGELSFPDSDGTNGQVIQTNGSGTLSFVDAGGAWSFVSSTTISNDATVDFTDLNESGASYLFVLEDVVPATDGVSLYFRTSTDNGSTYDSGASTYITTVNASYGGSNAMHNNTADTKYELNSNNASLGMGTGTGETFHGDVLLRNPQTTGGYKIISSHSRFYSAGALGCTVDGVGIRKSTTAIDAVRFLASSGNLSSGTIRVYKRSGS